MEVYKVKIPDQHYTLLELGSNLREEEFLLQEYKLSPMFGLEDYGNVAGTPVFSSKKIEDIIIEQLLSNSKYSFIANNLMYGIRKRDIIIGYSDKSRIKFILTRLKHKLQMISNWGLGFFYRPDKKIVILLDDNVTIFGNTVLPAIDTIIHECLHLAMANDAAMIFNITKDKILIPYYTKLLNASVSIANKHLDLNINFKVDLVTLEKIIYALCVKESSPADLKTFKEILKEYEDIWSLVFEDIKNPNDKKEVLYTFDAPFLFFATNVVPKSQNTRKILNAMYKAYSNTYNLFKIDGLHSHVGQEFANPSEVLAVLSVANKDHIHPSILKAIKSIKWK